VERAFVGPNEGRFQRRHLFGGNTYFTQTYTAMWSTQKYVLARLPE
jgi:hypothetical protein